MLIDQFNEYELAQIRRELRMIQELRKDFVYDEARTEIDTIFDRESYHKECIFPYRAVGDAVGTIVDYTLDNFVYRRNGRAKKQIGWYRSQNVSQNIQEEYRQMIGEILDIIRKHKKQKEFSLKKPDELR